MKSLPSGHCWVGIAALAFVFVSAPSFGAPVDLGALGINWDFELPNLDGTAGAEQFSRSNMGAGWAVAVISGGSSNYGVQDPNATFYGSAHPLPAPFQGNQFGFVNMTTSGTTVDVNSASIGPLQANSVYTLNVAVGERGGSSFDIDYEIGLLADGVEIGTFATGNTTPGNILDLQYVLDTSTIPGNVGEDVRIRISGVNTGGGFAQMNFDNVRLNIVPEPSSSALAAVGLFGLFGCTRRRR